MNREGLYDKIKEKKFKESLGIYYQDGSEEITEDVPNANRVIKRVITYTEI